jgi:hypothetical protein
MSQLHTFLFLASSAPIGLYVGQATLPEYVERPALSSKLAWYTFVQEVDSDAPRWLDYERSCTAGGGRWDHALHCCHAPRSPVRPYDAHDEDDDPIAEK